MLNHEYKSKFSRLYLGDVVNLGELESDAQAAKERRDERASARERRDLHFNVWSLGIHGGLELLERLRYFPQRLLVCHWSMFWEKWEMRKFFALLCLLLFFFWMQIGINKVLTVSNINKEREFQQKKIKRERCFILLITPLFLKADSLLRFFSMRVRWVADFRWTLLYAFFHLLDIFYTKDKWEDGKQWCVSFFIGVPNLIPK